MSKFLRIETIIPAVLALISLVVLLLALSLPVSVQTRTIPVAWEHTGRFDYTAYLNPSHLVGPEPAVVLPAPTPQPQSDLKYPAAQVEKFKFVFDYSFIGESATPEVNQQISAVAVYKNAEQDTISAELLSDQSVSGASSRSTFYFFPDNITGDIELTISVYPVIQTAEGPLYESFIQTLPIKQEGSVFTLKRETLQKEQSGLLGSLAYLQKGETALSVYLKSDSPLGALELQPPALPPEAETLPPELTAITPEDVIYTRLLDHIDAVFSYHLKNAQSIQDLDHVAAVTAVVEAPKVWSRTLELAPLTPQTGDFSLPFSLDLTRYLELVNSIRNETGLSSDSYLLTIRADVQVRGRTDYGRIDEVFSPSISAVLDKNTLVWNEKLNQSQPGSIEIIQTGPNLNRYLGLSRGELTILALCLLVIFLAAAVFLGWWTVRHPAAASHPAADQVLLLRKKYGQHLVESAAGPPVDPLNTVRLNSFEDLAKIADQLDKPVVHQAPATPGQPHLYQVLDGAVAYEYSLESPDDSGVENGVADPPAGT